MRYRGVHEPNRIYAVANGAWHGGAHTETPVDAEPFLAFLRDAFPDATPESLESLTGIPARRFREFFVEGKSVVSLDLVDRAFTKGLGRPDLVAALYPMEDAV